MPKTEVAITIDTEFEVNGSLGRPQARDPIGAEGVYRMANGHSHGLGFILDTLEAHGLRATFFVEVLNTLYFGEAPMARIIADITARDQDVQLHAHPCWRYLKGRKQGLIREGEYTDSIVHFDGEAMREVVEESVDIFQNLTGGRPVAFRSGGLHVTRALYPALRDAGIRLASNIGVGLFKPVEKELQLTGGIHQIDGVTEIPVFSYRGAGPFSRRANKVATLIGSSWTELKQMLIETHERNAGPVVILTHASEYSRETGTPAARNYLPYPRVQQRLRSLCRFLDHNCEQYSVVTFGGQQDAWLGCRMPSDHLLTAPLGGMLQRIFENNVLPRIGIN